MSDGAERPIPVGCHDAAVVGLGPAGRALAHHCAAAGLRVLALDPAPDAPWRPTYGVWADEIDDLPGHVARSRTDGPVIVARGAHPLPRTYVVLDNAALQRHLHLDGVDIRARRLTDDDVSALAAHVPVVVDARGARPSGDGGSLGADRRGVEVTDAAPAQTAYGVVVPEAAAAPALDGHPALLMDWRTDWRSDSTGGARRAAGADAAGADGGPAAGVPTFLYAVPLGAGRVLLEETALAAAPAVDLPELRRRLRTRLLRRGVDPAAVDHPLATEHVVIPMRGRDAPPPAGTIAVGVGGRGGNIVTGYSVAHSLRTAPALAATLAAGGEPRPPTAPAGAQALREAGLRALLRLSVDGTLDLFDAFGRLPADSQRAFLSRSAGPGPLLGSMWRMFATMPPRGKADLVRATLGHDDPRSRLTEPRPWPRYR